MKIMKIIKDHKIIQLFDDISTTAFLYKVTLYRSDLPLVTFGDLFCIPTFVNLC